jgi:hypothetical protein
MKASKLGNLVNIHLSAVRTDELETRLAALEQPCRNDSNEL